MLKLYDKLWDQNATMAMAALVERGDTPNPWEVARKAYELADCMAEIREKVVKDQATFLPHTMNDSTGGDSVGVSLDGVSFGTAEVINLSGAQTITLDGKSFEPKK